LQAALARKAGNDRQQPKSPASLGRPRRDGKSTPPSSAYKAGGDTAPKIKGDATPSSPGKGASQTPTSPSRQPFPPFALKWVSASVPPASPEAKELHNYLRGASADNLCRTIFREQVNSSSFPRKWVSTLQASMAGVRRKIIKAVQPVVAAHGLNKLVPAIDLHENFDW